MSYELQKIDCNCNDCKYLIRDLDTQNKWKEWNRNQQEARFNRGKELGHIRPTAQFQFDQKKLTLQYGNCSKLNKPITFLPGHCQLETQSCFKHRKDQ